MLRTANLVVGKAGLGGALVGTMGFTDSVGQQDKARRGLAEIFSIRSLQDRFKLLLYNETTINTTEAEAKEARCRGS
jgi:hypothetical protein